MAVSGLVRIVPADDDMREITLHCEHNGLKKPLTQCGKKQLGDYGEDLACLFLESKGLEILERNWRCSYGEVDIIAEADGMLALVEVKTRIADPDDVQINPELAVTFRKQNRYRKLALMYLSRQTKYDTVRFDVVSVKLTGECDARLRHYPSAYEWDE
ncbi:MAG: YraN family protein [Atopobiaceae bacterium]|jgi:putative endonuclease|nr:YraN family protein [Atopobiaceae bacterium]